MNYYRLEKAIPGCREGTKFVYYNEASIGARMFAPEGLLTPQFIEETLEDNTEYFTKVEMKEKIIEGFTESSILNAPLISQVSIYSERVNKYDVPVRIIFFPEAIIKDDVIEDLKRVAYNLMTLVVQDEFYNTKYVAETVDELIDIVINKLNYKPSQVLPIEEEPSKVNVKETLELSNNVQKLKKLAGNLCNCLKNGIFELGVNDEININKTRVLIEQCLQKFNQ